MFDELDFAGSKVVADKLRKIIGNKTVLILENSNGLDAAIENFYEWCVENKVRVNIIYCVDEINFEYLMERIKEADIIAYMSTYTYEIVNHIATFIKSLKDYRLKIIECYITEPGFVQLPKEAKQHEMWILKSQDHEVRRWHLRKLSTSKRVDY
jgi:mannitol-1-phosphate/altronate dehydrogenase